MDDLQSNKGRPVRMNDPERLGEVRFVAEAQGPRSFDA